MQVLRDVQAMAPERIEALRKVVLAVRPMFLWHTDDNRKSAVDYVIHELCSWEPTSSKSPPHLLLISSHLLLLIRSPPHLILIT